MEIMKNYRDHNNLRDSFNELAENVFALNFEDWYQNGFWKNNYNPYSIYEDGKVVSNVSVNICNMVYNGKKITLLQLGTVMTNPNFRGKGYARILMEEVIKDYEGKVDGIYLFANDSVLDFYPKFGFKPRIEYQYSKTIKGVETPEDVTLERIPMETPEDWAMMVDILNSRKQNAKMYMVENSGLYMFYLSQFMKECVYYLEKYDTYVIAEIEEGTLLLYAIIGDATENQVVEAFGDEIENLVLLYTPNNLSEYEKEEVQQEDTTLFVRGKVFEEELKDEEFMFQTITHA